MLGRTDRFLLVAAACRSAGGSSGSAPCRWWYDNEVAFHHEALPFKDLARGAGWCKSEPNKIARTVRRCVRSLSVFYMNGDSAVDDFVTVCALDDSFAVSCEIRIESCDAEFVRNHFPYVLRSISACWECDSESSSNPEAFRSLDLGDFVVEVTAEVRAFWLGKSLTEAAWPRRCLSGDGDRCDDCG